MSLGVIVYRGLLSSGVNVIRGEYHRGLMSWGGGGNVAGGDCPGVIVAGVNVSGVNVAKPADLASIAGGADDWQLSKLVGMSGRCNKETQ